MECNTLMCIITKGIALLCVLPLVYFDWDPVIEPHTHRKIGCFSRLFCCLKIRVLSIDYAASSSTSHDFLLEFQMRISLHDLPSKCLIRAWRQCPRRVCERRRSFSSNEIQAFASFCQAISSYSSEVLSLIQAHLSLVRYLIKWFNQIVCHSLPGTNKPWEPLV